MTAEEISAKTGLEKEILGMRDLVSIDAELTRRSAADAYCYPIWALP